MGATYTRQSSYTDGDVITAAHTNSEFDQLLAAFQASSGHTHDGTANEGGPITKLLGTAITIGDGTSGTDIAVTFDGESNDGILTWMEDEDYFQFSDDILISSTEKLYFNDTGTHIFSNADGDLDLVSDGTNADAIKLASAGGITLDAAGDIILDADGDDITLKNGSDTYGSFTNSSGELVIKSGSTPTTAMTFSGANVTFAGTVTIGSAGISEAELEILDGATVTTTELNIIDGDTTASSTTVVDADRVVFNDAGTMKQVAVTDLAAYFDDEITAMPNLVTTAATTVGALNSGSITSGFGSIDNGSSAITTTGTITYGSLSDGSITITAFVDEDNMASNSATLVPTQQSVKAYVDTQLTAEDLDVTTDSGTIDIDLDSETLTIAGGEGIDTSATGTTVTIAGEDASTSNKGVASFSDTFFSVSSGAVSLDAAQTGITSVVNTALEIGRDADNRIKFGTDNQIIFEVDGGDNVIFKTSGEIEATSLDISGDADIDGTLEADAITVNGTALNTVIAGVTVTNATTAAVATTVTISDNERTNEENAVVFTAGGDVDGGNIGLESDGDLTYNPSTGTISATVFKGNIDAVDGDFDGTLEADAITVGGTALNTVIAGVTVTNATNSAHVLVTDNESTNEENLITFVEDATSSTGNVGLEMDGHLTYNPSTGTVTATVFKGNIDAVDGDFDGTLEADAITVGGASLSSVIQDEATALAIALG